MDFAKILNSEIFNLFLRPTTNRRAFICQWLKTNKVPFSVVNLTGKQHIIVKYHYANYNSKFKTKTIVAHYDKEDNSQGANDNSAACFQLMFFSKYLCSINIQHNIKIIFTDGEEAGALGIKKQGAFGLGSGLKKLKMEKDDIFVFDMCGLGNCLIISQSGIYGRDRQKTKMLDDLHNRACNYASQACPNQWISLLTAYSDNAGFIANGLNAQVITVLPKHEAYTLFNFLSKTPKNELINLIIKNKKPEKNSYFEKIIPQTWQYMHTAQDTKEKLTPEAFVLIEKYLKFLIYQNTSKS